jgi:hypothetical protein
LDERHHYTPRRNRQGYLRREHTENIDMLNNTTQFDLEEQIVSCTGVVADLNLLFEELCENTQFTTDQATNFVLGLNTIYDAKFKKLWRTFEDFLKNYYEISNRLLQLEASLKRGQSLAELFDEDDRAAILAMTKKKESEKLRQADVYTDLTLDELFDEEESRLPIEDEFGFR